MLKYFTFFVLLFSIEVFFAQDLTAVMKMPEVIAPGEDYVVEVTILKGSINSYIKFTQKLPPNFRATKIETNGGNFAFEDSVVRIVWLFPPASSEFSFSYKVKVPKDFKGTQKIGGKIYYFFNTNREVFSFDKREVAYGTVMGNSVSSSAVKENDSLKLSNSNKKDTVIKVVVVHDTIVSPSVTTNATSIVKDSLPATAPLTVNKVIPSMDSVSKSNLVVKEKEIPTHDSLSSHVTKVETVPVTKDSVPIASVNKSVPTLVVNTMIENKEPVSASAKVISPTENNAAASASGLSYCVQLGAFRENVPLELADKFLKISAKGIKNFKDNNGFTTFTVGNFKTHDEAIGLKNEMLEKGFQGAFIVAFPTNKTMETSGKAEGNKALSTTATKAAPVKSENTIKETKVISPVAETAPEIKKVETKVEAHTPPMSAPSSANKTFRVQIGAFKEEVPLATANKFLKLAAKGVKNLKDDRGFTVYTVGDFSNREDAAKLKDELIEKGFQGSFIVTFENGKLVK